MAITPAASSTVLSKSSIPSQKQIIRTTSEKFKGSSQLLNDAIEVHKEREKELLSTIQKLSEQLEQQQIAQERADETHQKERLVDQKKIFKLNQGIENFLSLQKFYEESIQKICEKISHRQDQQWICHRASDTYWHKWDGTISISHAEYGSCSGRWWDHVAFLRAKLDDSNKNRVELKDSLGVFGKETKADVKTIQEKTAALKIECEALKKQFQE